MKLRLSLKQERGALQRVLVTAGRRGFETVAITARSSGARMEVELEVRGARDAGMLARTLERLVDVERVEVLS